MRALEELRAMLAAGQYSLSRHALRRIIERNIAEPMIRQAGAGAVLVEDYPDDKYSPSCLLLGFTDERRPLHLQVSRADNPTVKIITLYEPSLTEWHSDYLHRRRS